MMTYNIFHKNTLQRVSEGLRRRRDYLLLGPDGIGKTRFLKNLETDPLKLNSDGAQFHYCEVDFTTIIDLLKNIRSALNSSKTLQVFLLDNIDIAIIRQNDPTPFIDLLDLLAKFPDWMSPSPRYIIASSEAPWELLEQRYPGVLKGHKLPDAHRINLGLVVEEEAREFLKSSLEKHEILKNRVDEILKIVGSYPWFLGAAIEVLDALNLSEFNIETFKNAYADRSRDKLESLWELCSSEEKHLLCVLASGLDISKEPEYLLYSVTLTNKALIKNGNQLFSLNFCDFIQKTVEYKEYKRKRQMTWLAKIDKITVMYFILAVIFLYVALLVVVSFWNNVELILAMTLVFVTLFIVLMVFYINSE